MNNKERIGKRIKELRAEKGMTQRDLALASKMANSKIANIELGKYSAGLDVLSRIAEALGCRVIIADKKREV
jgi:transcriptional regulator with XRE-family HTH domain